MVQFFEQRGILCQSGLVLMCALCMYGLGPMWSCLLAVTLWAVLTVYRKIADETINLRNSVENLHNVSNFDSKKKRLIAKKKEKYDRRRQKAMNDADGDDDDVDSGFQRSQQEFDENIYGTVDYEAISGYHGVFALSNATNSSTKQVPSLRSPQPLLSAFNSRISRRELNALKTQGVQKRYHPLSPRSVFDTLQNQNIMSQQNKSWTEKQAKMFNSPFLEAHKAVSPPTGKYFSRIKHNAPKDDKSAFNATIDKSGYENQIETENLDAPHSKAAIVKVLQEKTASKRKRAKCEHSTLTVEEQFNKKRRVQDEVLDVTVNGFKVVETKEITGSDNAEMLNECVDENVRRKIRNKYGLKDNEVESITEDDDYNDDMDVDLKQSKRKIEKDDIQIQDKKRSKDEHVNQLKDSKNTPSLKSEARKATPVRSIETQTPTKFDVNDRLKNSPCTPNTLKTPYKKVFASGFPSNLNPNTAEKRRKIPIYSVTLAHDENIEVEEYASLGITSAAYTADKKAAMERANALLNGKDDVDDNGDNSAQVSQKSSSEATSDQLSSKTLLSQFPTFSSAVSASIQLPIESVPTTSPSKNGISLPAVFPVSSFGASVSQQTTGKSSEVINESIPTGVSVAPNSSGTVATTTTVATISSLITSPTATILGKVAPISGTDVNKQPMSTVSQTSISVMPSFTFGQSAESKTEAEVGSKNVTQISQAGGFSTSSQNTPSAFTGFNFGSKIEPNQNTVAPFAIQSDVATTSTVGTKPTTVPLTFGSSIEQKQSPFSFGNKEKTTDVSTNPSQKLATSTQSSGFSFGTSTTTQSSSVSQSVSSNVFGGFKFGTSPQPATNASVLTTNQNITTGGFKFDGFKSSAPSSAGFSFAASFPQTSQASASVTTSIAASSSATDTSKPFFQLSTSKPAFGSTVSSSSMPSTNLFGAPTTSLSDTKLSFGNGSNNATMATFGIQPSSQTPSVFGASPQVTNTAGSTFGATASTSSMPGSIFGTSSVSNNAGVPQFGALSQSTAPNASIFSAVSQSPSTGSSIFGAPTQIANKNPLFGTAGNQVNQQSGTFFGASAKSTEPSGFGVNSATSAFSFGTNQTTPLFGSKAAATTTSGLLFGSSSQPASTNTFGQFGGQTSSGSNPFAAGSVFGQTSADTTKTATKSGFSFGSSSAAVFGQASTNPSPFGTTQTPAPTVGQAQTGGFNFAAAAAQKPTTFSFGAASGPPSNGFASRPGTPTPFNNPQAPSSDIFGTPQQPGVGFAMGSGTTNRPTVRGRRRVRR